MRKINGILLMAMTFLSSFFWGCSQDDDTYQSDMYTLAEQMDTRTAEPEKPKKKKKITFTHTENNISLPKGVLDTPSLYGEYDDETLSVSISGFSGHAEVFVMNMSLYQVVAYQTETFTNAHQFDFALSGFATGTTYQIIVSLSNGDAYAGEFDL